MPTLGFYKAVVSSYIVPTIGSTMVGAKGWAHNGINSYLGVHCCRHPILPLNVDILVSNPGSTSRTKKC